MVRKNERLELVRAAVKQWNQLPEERRRGDLEGWIDLKMGCGRQGAADLIREALGECPSCRRVLTLQGYCIGAGVYGSGCRAVPRA